jgi:hypothetical protein
MSLVSKMLPVSLIAEALLSRAQISRVLIGIPTGPSTYLHTSRLSRVVSRHKALPSEGGAATRSHVGASLSSAQQYVEHDDRDRNAECQ